MTNMTTATHCPSACPLRIASIALLLFIIVWIEGATAQISISPKRVLLTSRERSCEVIITNSGNKPFEITAAIAARRLRTDSTGREWYDSLSTPVELQHSCHGWVKVFPKKFILPPNASRKVRLLAAPQTDLADGEYIGRLLLTSMESEIRRADSIDTTRITVDLRFRINMVLQVVYRKGEVNTGIELADARAIRSDSGTFVVVAVRGVGNAAYRGMLSVVLRSEDGRKLDSVVTPYIVEFTDLYQKLRLADIPGGRYELTLESRAELPGSAAELVLPAPAVRRTYTLVSDATSITLTGKDY